MAATTQVTVTKVWSKLADGDCTIQSFHSNYYYQIYVGTTTPADGSPAITTQMLEPTTFGYQSPVWCRVIDEVASATLNIIK